MDISVLKQNLLDKKLNHYYIFTGQELALQDIYIDKIKEISGLDVVRAEDLASIFTKLTTKTLIKSKPCIYVIRNDEQFFKTTETNWKKFLEAPNFRGNILILLYSDVEKTAKFCKFHEEILTRFDFIGPSLLRNRLQATTKMPPQYCEDIVKMCGNDYGRIKNELYKMNTLALANGYSWNTAYLEAKKCNLIHEEIGDIIFEFTGAIESRNIKKAYELWPKMKFTGDGPMRVLSVLYNSFRQIVKVQCTADIKQRTPEILGMEPGVLYMVTQKCGKYNGFELIHILKTLRYLEKGIKTGQVEEAFAMEYLMGTIW